MDYVKFVRQDEVNDYFSYVNCEGETEYLKFPRTMEMNVSDVEQWLKD